MMRVSVAIFIAITLIIDIFFDIKHNMGATQTVGNKDEFHVYQLQKDFILHICSGLGPETIQQCPNEQGSFRKGDIFHPLYVLFVKLHNYRVMFLTPTPRPFQ